MKLSDSFRSLTGRIDLETSIEPLQWPEEPTYTLLRAAVVSALSLQTCRQILQLPRWKFRSSAIIVVFPSQNINGMEHASSETREVTGPAGSTFK
jgi:hypothetical protein